MHVIKKSLLLVGFVLVSISCRAASPILEGILEPAAEDSDQAATRVAGYIYAGITLTAQAGGPTPTETPSPTPEASPTPTQTQALPSPLPALATSTAALVAKLPTPTEPPPAAATASACRYSAAVDAENVPEGKEIPLNHKFTKTWKIRNSGNCDWTPDFSFVCMTNCDIFKAPGAIPLSIRTIPPKGTTEIRMELQAPKGEKYVGKKIACTFYIRGAGKLIGIGTDGKSPFSVLIKPTD